MWDPNFLGDLVRAFETDAGNILGQSKRIRAHLVDGVLAIGLVDANGAAGAHSIRVQEYHDIPNHPLLGPRILDPATAHWANSLDFLQPPGIGFDDIEDFLAEFLDQLFCVSGADSFDHAAAEILFDAFAGRGCRSLEQLGFEMHPELAIANPTALSREPFSGIYRGKRPDHRDFIPVTARPDFEHCKAVLFIEESDALDQA